MSFNYLLSALQAVAIRFVVMIIRRSNLQGSLTTAFALGSKGLTRIAKEKRYP